MKCETIIIPTIFDRKYEITDKKTFDSDLNYLRCLINDTRVVSIYYLHQGKI